MVFFLIGQLSSLLQVKDTDTWVLEYSGHSKYITIYAVSLSLIKVITVLTFENVIEKSVYQSTSFEKEGLFFRIYCPLKYLFMILLF